MKKCSSETTFSTNITTSYPSLTARNSQRLGPTQSAKPPCWTGGPLTPLSSSSDLRSASLSPGRDATNSMARAVAAGHHFCLTRGQGDDEPPDDDIKRGRKSPFITSRTWPKSLRTRSVPSERSLAHHEGPVKPTFQQSRNNSEQKEQEPKRMTKSSSSICLKSSPNKDAGMVRNYVRVTDKIKMFQTKNKQSNYVTSGSTLPWSSKICTDKSEADSKLQRACSSPCLFVNKSSVKIRTKASPLKLHSQISVVASALEEKLHSVVREESENSTGNALGHSKGLGKSHENSVTNANLSSYMQATAKNVLKQDNWDMNEVTATQEPLSKLQGKEIVLANDIRHTSEAFEADFVQLREKFPISNDIPEGDRGPDGCETEIILKPSSVKNIDTEASRPLNFDTPSIPLVACPVSDPSHSPLTDAEKCRPPQHVALSKYPTLTDKCFKNGPNAEEKGVSAILCPSINDNTEITVSSPGETPLPKTCMNRFRPENQNTMDFDTPTDSSEDEELSSILEKCEKGHRGHDITDNFLFQESICKNDQNLNIFSHQYHLEGDIDHVGNRERATVAGFDENSSVSSYSGLVSQLGKGDISGANRGIKEDSWRQTDRNINENLQVKRHTHENLSLGNGKEEEEVSFSENNLGELPAGLGEDGESQADSASSDLYLATCEVEVLSRDRSGLRDRSEYNLKQVNPPDVRNNSKEDKKASFDIQEYSDKETGELDCNENFRPGYRRGQDRRGSMPEREIDEEDTETAELQVRLRKISGQSFVSGAKHSSSEEEDKLEENNIYCENEFDQYQENHPRRGGRRGSLPDREITEEDMETAEFQTNLRKLSAKMLTPESSVEKELSGEEAMSPSQPKREIFDADSEETKSVKIGTDEEFDFKSTFESTVDIEEAEEKSTRKEPILRPTIPARGRRCQQGSLRRSRTWTSGFGSNGQRYESVSDAGLPPPPPAPSGPQRSVGGGGIMGPEELQRRGLGGGRQSSPCSKSYRPLSQSSRLRNPESGPKLWKQRRQQQTRDSQAVTSGCRMAFPADSRGGVSGVFGGVRNLVGHPPPGQQQQSVGLTRSRSEGSLVSQENLEYECRVSCSSREKKMGDLGGPEEEEPQEVPDLSTEQIQQLMAVIAGMDSVKHAGVEQDTQQSSPPPTDEEIDQFINYMGMGVVNQDRLDFDEERKRDQEEGNQPEPPKRNKQANQYFWRRHYLSIIQEEEEHGEQTPGTSSRTTSRPNSTYENSLCSRLQSRLGALSPMVVEQAVAGDQSLIKDIRASWGSEMSVDSLTSVNSILSEEGSITSNGSFVSDTFQSIGDGVCDDGEKDIHNLCQKAAAAESLSCLLDSVHPPSNTPDSMLSCDSPTVRLSRTEPDNDDRVQVSKYRMGSKFKQQLREIEEAKQKKGKGDCRPCNEISPVSDSGHGGSTSPPQVALARPLVPLSQTGQSDPINLSPPHLTNISPVPQILCNNVLSSLKDEMETMKETTTTQVKQELDCQLLPAVTSNIKTIPSARLRKPRGRRSLEI